MKNGNPNVFLRIFTRTAPVFLLLAAASACDSQGVDYVPPDGVGADTGPNADIDAFGGSDAGPGEDWWSGGVLGWRAEEIPIREAFFAISGVDNGPGYVVYVAGFRGAVLRYDSATGVWTDVSPTTTKAIRGIWAVGPKQVFICGDEGLLMRYEVPPGATYPEWTDASDPLPKETLHAVHGTGPDDVWVVGDNGLVLRNQGAGWVSIPKADLLIPEDDTSDLHAVYARAPDDVLVSGEGMVIWWNGTEWDQRDVEPSHGFLSIAGAGDQIWVGSDGGYLWSVFEGVWSEKPAPVYYDYDAIWVAADGRVFATGEHPSPQSIIWNGAGEPWDQLDVVSPEDLSEPWSVTPKSQITGLWGRSPEDIFACTQQQQILHYAMHQ